MPSRSATELFSLSLHDALPIFMRRAALAGGRRLADRGRIRDAEHFVDAGFEEMRSLLSGADGPSPDELAEDRKSTRLNSSHGYISYAVSCLKKTSSFHLLFEQS